MVVLTEVLQSEAGRDPLEDRFRVGYITAVKDILNVTFEEIREDDSTSGSQIDR